jgi:hypothetical protein
MRELIAIALVATSLTACAGEAKPAATTPRPASAAGPAPDAPAGAPAAAAPALAGRWVEFWAVSGAADTQCYAFFDDGRFGWHAATASGEAQTRRWGHYRIEGGGLVLEVEGREDRAGCSGDVCRVALAPPLEQQLSLGECPANDEAKTLDPAYTCVAIAGHAFWRDNRAAPDPAAFIP